MTIFLLLLFKVEKKVNNRWEIADCVTNQSQSRTARYDDAYSKCLACSECDDYDD